MAKIGPGTGFDGISLIFIVDVKKCKKPGTKRGCLGWPKIGPGTGRLYHSHSHCGCKQVQKIQIHTKGE
jgi:hypothetical protein